MTHDEIQHYTAESIRCLESPSYFARTYCQIMSGEDRNWVPFSLWAEQERTLRAIQESKLTVILKARQLGLTWLCLSYALWEFLFNPGSLVLLFSRRDDEAVDLLKRRFVGMHSRLPEFLRSDPVTTSNDHEFAISSDSRVKAFPTTAGDSYTANLAIVDEADLIPDLGDLLASVKPTIDAPGNKLVLLSRVDKRTPQSPFKKIYRAARAGENRWSPVFLPWSARPDRDAAWYEEQKRDAESRTGALDALYEQYPATDAEALMPNSLDKRIPGPWLTRCFVGSAPLSAVLFLPGLRIFAEPVPGCRYVIGADPAEGSPNSDDSAACILEVDSGEQVAVLQGKTEPSVFASYIAEISKHYGDAPALVERNNHGWAVLQWLREHSRVRCLCGKDGKPGWLTLSASKAMMYSLLSDSLRECATTIHDFASFHQLAAIEGTSLSAPKGLHDDLAVAFGLAVVAQGKAPGDGPRSVVIPERKQRADLFGAPPTDWDKRPQDQEKPGLWTRRPTRLFG